LTLFKTKWYYYIIRTFYEPNKLSTVDNFIELKNVLKSKNMKNENIKKYLKYLQSEKKYDNDFVKLLIDSCKKGEEGEVTAENLLRLISERYVENKKNKT